MSDVKKNLPSKYEILVKKHEILVKKHEILVKKIKLQQKPIKFSYQHSKHYCKKYLTKYGQLAILFCIEKLLIFSSNF